MNVVDPYHVEFAYLASSLAVGFGQKKMGVFAVFGSYRGGPTWECFWEVNFRGEE
jgi:hypothetical protein